MKHIISWLSYQMKCLREALYKELALCPHFHVKFLRTLLGTIIATKRNAVNYPHRKD
jgi:hypothetical protein